MTELPLIQVPKELCFLFTSNFNDNNSQILSNIETVLKKNNFLKISMKLFGEFDSKLRIDAILSSLGWINFRNRLTSIYIYYLTHNKFPTKSHLELISSITDFEKKLQPFTITGNSRAFLLGIYAKIVNFNIMSKMDKNLFPALFDITENNLSVLRMSMIKVSNIDWLYFSLWQFSQFLSIDEIKNSLLKDDHIFKSLLSQLNENQKKIFFKHMLYYGHAIHEHFVFTEERV